MCEHNNKYECKFYKYTIQATKCFMIYNFVTNFEGVRPRLCSAWHDDNRYVICFVCNCKNLRTLKGLH